MFEKARSTYKKALDVKPGDADVSTDLGISYFVQDPPDYDRAASELQKVISANPKHDRAIQFLVQTYTKQGKVAEAEKTLTKLIDLNPSNPAITDLRTAISNAKASR
jgi:Flp pilus assembly protein TadD